MERKGISVVYRVKSEVSERIKIINSTSHTLKINQEGFEQYGEFVGSDDHIVFFWDDPFAKHVIGFEMLFNNQANLQGFFIQLEKFEKKKVTFFVDLSLDKKSNKIEVADIHKIKPALRPQLLTITIEKSLSGDQIIVKIENYVQKTKNFQRLFSIYPRRNTEEILHMVTPEKEKEFLELRVHIFNVGLSLIDEKPREIFFFSMENLIFKGIFNQETMMPLQCFFDVMDVQGDY